MLMAFIVIGLVTAGLFYLVAKRYKRLFFIDSTVLNPIPLMSAGTVLGMGLGGFADGIALHQILQWHEMLTAKIPADTFVNKSVNMFWDGIFHAFTLLTTILGVYLLFKVLHRPMIVKDGSLLIASMLGGWGIFNLIEGFIDHHLLKLHNVYEYSGYRDWYNYGFLTFGAILLLPGLIISHKYFNRKTAGQAKRAKVSKDGARPQIADGRAR
jgi:uncharacterized membrane protein